MTNGNGAGRTVVITGVSQGIGRATALRFAEAGCDIGGLHLGPDEAAASLEAELAALGAKVHLVHADAGDAASHDALADQMLTMTGRLDVWVNNAARLMVRPIVDTTDEQWHGLLAANLHGYFYGCRTAARVMQHNGGGRIINVTSAARILAVADLGAYATAKGGIEALTKVLALELAPHGVTVNAVAPGAIDTPLNDGAYTSAVRRTYDERIPLGHIGSAADVAATIVFLASPAAEYITGQELVVDGGLTINGTVGHAGSAGP